MGVPATIPVAWLHPTEPWPWTGLAMVAFWLLVIAGVFWFVRSR